MYYCEGKNCSRRDQCAYHEVFEEEHLRQHLDNSTEGYGSVGIANNGVQYSHHEFYCGDNADYYKRYKALGWREGQEYRNSEGTICDEVCLSCPYNSLCFCILEAAGMVFRPGDRVRFDCEDIKANSQQYKKWLIERGWSEAVVNELLKQT